MVGSTPQNLNDDKGPMLLGLWWAQVVIVTIIVGLRFYTRHLMRGIVIEDWLMLMALVRSQQLKETEEVYCFLGPTF